MTRILAATRPRLPGPRSGRSAAQPPDAGPSFIYRGVMARKTKDAPGRVTPKGSPGRRRRPGRPASHVGLVSGRYTAPIPAEYRASPWWVPVLMLTFFGSGIICILLNYLSVLPGGASNGYLLVGLGLIVVGFITATRWH